MLQRAIRKTYTQYNRINMSTWSRLVRFLPPDHTGAPLVGEPVDPKLDVGLATFEGKEVEVDVYEGTSVLNAGKKTGERKTVGKLLSPVSENEVGTIRCIGLNVSSSLIRSLVYGSELTFETV
jgi:hypothetical protein